MRPIILVLLCQLLICGSLRAGEIAPDLPTARDCVSMLDQTSLNADQVIELLSALPHLRDVRVRVLTVERDVRRTVVLVGENHHAYLSDIRRLRPLLDEFETMATENGITNDEPAWRYKTLDVARALTLPRRAWERLFTARQAISAMHFARYGRKLEGRVRNIERGHRPHWSEELHLLALAGVSALRIVLGGFDGLVGGRKTALAREGLEFADSIMKCHDRDLPLTGRRDRTIAREIDALTREKKSGPSSLMIVGLVHLTNTVEELVTRHGFTEVLVPMNRVSQSDTGVSEL